MATLCGPWKFCPVWYADHDEDWTVVIQYQKVDALFLSLHPQYWNKKQKENFDWSVCIYATAVCVCVSI